MKKLDAYFLSEDPDDIHVSDRVWFYGTYVAVALVLAITLMGIK